MKILEVRLKTADLLAQKAFYQDTLDLPLLAETPDKLTIQVGRSRLTFEREAGFEGVYHFAFDVPENQIEQARTWLASRVPISQEGHDEVVHFTAWNAHSLYFYDPAGNILEFIARHNQPNANNRPFDTNSILSISEIGLATSDVLQTVDALHSAFGLEVYSGPAGVEFAAVGDEHGLFIVVRRGRIWFSSRSSPADFYPLSVTIAGKTNQTVQFADQTCQIISQPEAS